MPQTVRVAAAKDVPEGGVKVVKAGEKEIAVFNAGGALFAVDNLCPHRGGPLGEGTLENGVITCPWHGWQFKAGTGECTHAPNVKVACYPAKKEGEDVFVEI